MRSVAVYSVLRILAFLVPFGLLLLFPAFQELPWLAAVFAAIIGLALSMLFLRPRLDAVSTGLAERRTTRKAERADAEVEDEANEAARGAAPDAEGPAVRQAPGAHAEASGDQPTNAQNSSAA